MSEIMALSTQPYKGARDFYPEDKRLQKYMFKTLSKVAERYGYEAIDAPILEPLELYTAKSGDEIVNEQTYTFTDRGDRKVAIRPEMTPSVSRMVAGRRQELAYPARWYCIPNFWRYERPQRGRLREFWQLNVDIFGVDGIEAEHEIILIADQCLKAFGAKQDAYTIKINSRKLINALFFDYLKLDSTQAETMARLIDRMHKTDYGQFVGQVDAVFTPSQREVGASEKLLEFLKVKTLNDLPEGLSTHASIDELRRLMDLLTRSGVSNVVFDITVMRGLDYYTDVVFEVFDNHPDNNRAMFGGGRYDGLVGLFGVEPVPTVGFGMGDVTLQNFLEVHGLLPKLEPETDIYVVLIGDVYVGAQSAIQRLRQMGARVAVDSTGRKPEKQLKTAIKKGIHYAMFIGENELASEQFMIKNLVTAQEEKHGLERIVSIIKRRNGFDPDIEEDV
jgi:histidyl-tRNA synthetase